MKWNATGERKRERVRMGEEETNSENELTCVNTTKKLRRNNHLVQSTQSLKHNTLKQPHEHKHSTLCAHSNFDSSEEWVVVSHRDCMNQQHSHTYTNIYTKVLEH